MTNGQARRRRSGPEEASAFERRSSPRSRPWFAPTIRWKASGDLTVTSARLMLGLRRFDEAPSLGAKIARRHPDNWRLESTARQMAHLVDPKQGTRPAAGAIDERLAFASSKTSSAAAPRRPCRSSSARSGWLSRRRLPCFPLPHRRTRAACGARYAAAHRGNFECFGRLDPGRYYLWSYGSCLQANRMARSRVTITYARPRRSKLISLPECSETSRCVSCWSLAATGKC